MQKKRKRTGKDPAVEKLEIKASEVTGIRNGLPIALFAADGKVLDTPPIAPTASRVRGARRKINTKIRNDGLM